MMPWIIDIFFVAVIIFAIVFGAKRGFFRSVSGIAGTVLGFIGAKAFDLSLATHLEKPLSSIMTGVFEKADIQAKLAKVFESLQNGIGSVGEKLQSAGIPEFIADMVEGTVKNAGITTDELALKCAEGTAADSLGLWAAHAIAPIIAFILLFIAIKLAVSLVCRLLSANIPVLKAINKLAGGILGIVSGLLIVIFLCWGIVSFAPKENIGYINRPVLEESIIGGAITDLFF